VSVLLRDVEKQWKLCRCEIGMAEEMSGAEEVGEADIYTVERSTSAP
jgi:hypothetical protein